MKLKVISVNEETGEVELDLDEEAKAYLIQIGFETLVREALDEGGS